ncbi:hypothetical protein CAGGBEG34_30044 [Candidatus Glomeribacter gigasporarum BEG34]|uniref:Uncharacterized protein n=1 Tax=Candidatus Glomeribacter gigasporarum BEG34 TaxID=1070319 RepID=G2JBC6_9BURK|nr:antirestriction protein ArdA [Candidatus Glomeribacter gigasporarum]CCD30080.1 hypothetical protein CAGGBEG34_30044 [Candidatus Glomeribacter gigasporarum BEG34]
MSTTHECEKYVDFVARHGTQGKELLVEANYDLQQAERLFEKKACTDFITTHGEVARVLLEDREYSLADAERLMDEHYEGAYKDETDFARHYVDCKLTEADFDDWLAEYIDYARVAKRLLTSREFWTVYAEGKTHVFTTV